jgi:hypothetical protein
MNPADIRKYLKNPSLLNDSTLDATKRLTELQPASWLGWALWLRNLKNINSSLYAESVMQVALRVPNRKWLKEFLETPVASELDLPETGHFSIDDYELGVTTDKEDQENTNNQSKMELIDRFLYGGGTFAKQMPPIEFSPDNVAQKAIEESDDFVTETFANLLFSQGNLEKAIQSFEKLILKYPEKSIYFAARIEEIKKLKNH